MSKMPAIPGREAIRAFEKIGYVVDHQTGSHVILRQTKAPHRRLSGPDHREFAKGTLRSWCARSD
ncbi:MAG: hypothetical protein AMXMBFR13_12990 [Phycisphaerae bacterium]